MCKKFCLLLIITTLSCTTNAQVKTNFNNPEKLTIKEKFSINYSAAVFETAAPDVKSPGKRVDFSIGTSINLIYNF